MTETVPNWSKGVSPRVKLGFAAAILALVLSSLLTYAGARHLINAKDWVTHSHLVIQKLREVRNALHEAETEQRGYLLTGAAAYLDEFYRARNDVPLLVDELHSLTADSPSRQQQVGVIRQRVDARLEVLEQVANVRARSGSEAAQQQVASGEGTRLMQAASQELNKLQHSETEILKVRDESWRNGVRNLFVGLATTAFINLLLFGWLFNLIRREVSARWARESEHLQARQQLERRVAERTEDLEVEVSERTRMVADLETRNSQMTLLKSMGDQLQACFTIEEAGGAIRHYSEQLFPGWSGRVSILSSSRNILESTVEWGDLSVGSDVFRPDECWALRRGRMHHVEPGSTDLACPHLEHPPSGHSICVPLTAQGDTLGAINLQRATNGTVSEATLDFIHTVAEHIALVLANLRLRQVLQAQSVRDALTGLFNRRYMEESLERELRRSVRENKPLSVLMLDLDHFKRLNDTYGHDAGDAVLRNLGQVLKTAIRAEDIACRYGGEEFTLIMPDAAESEAVQRAWEVIRVLGTSSFVHNGVSLGPFSVSIGVATCQSIRCEASHLIRVADKALYQAKANGRGRVEIGSLDLEKPTSVQS